LGGVDSQAGKTNPAADNTAVCLKKDLRDAEVLI